MCTPLTACAFVCIHMQRMHLLCTRAKMEDWRSFLYVRIYARKCACVFHHNKARSLIFNAAETTTSTQSEPGEACLPTQTFLPCQQETKSGATVWNGSKHGPEHPRRLKHDSFDTRIKHVLFLCCSVMHIEPTFTLIVHVAPLLHTFMLISLICSLNVSYDLIHSPSLALSHITFIFTFLAPIHQHSNKRSEITAEKWTALFIFRAMYTPAGWSYEVHSTESRGEVHLSLLPHVKHRSVRVILYTSIASAHTRADTYPCTHTHTHLEETPPVWVFKSKQTLMSHLSVSLTSVLLLEQSFLPQQWEILYSLLGLVASCVRFSQ